MRIRIIHVQSRDIRAFEVICHCVKSATGGARHRAFLVIDDRVNMDNQAVRSSWRYDTSCMRRETVIVAVDCSCQVKRRRGCSCDIIQVEHHIARPHSTDGNGYTT